jgi:hypothetical protein
MALLLTIAALFVPCFQRMLDPRTTMNDRYPFQRGKPVSLLECTWLSSRGTRWQRCRQTWYWSFVPTMIPVAPSAPPERTETLTPVKGVPKRQPMRPRTASRRRTTDEDLTPMRLVEAMVEDAHAEQWVLAHAARVMPPHSGKCDPLRYRCTHVPCMHAANQIFAVRVKPR